MNLSTPLPGENPFLRRIVNSMSEQRQQLLVESGTNLSVGQLLTALVGPSMRPDTPVRIAYGHAMLKPCRFTSYRGYYDDLAITPCDHGQRGHEHTTIPPIDMTSTFAQALERCIGQTFTGYKGGEYLMTAATPLWVAPYGSTGMALKTCYLDDRNRFILGLDVEDILPSVY